MDMCLKMIDDIEQMQGLTIEVLEKMATLAMEMRKVAYEFNSTTGLIQNGTNTDKTTQSLASSFTNTTVYRISEPSLDTLLCEELRYSKLLDNACTKNTAEERMVYVSSFIILKAFK
ncbi:hypothetical protein ANCCEY_13041, partial [Ancylostoma ceylanicum]